MLAHWTQDFVDVDGIRIHYTRTGGAHKPPLVLAHGFSDSGLCWLPVARDLEAHYDVIMPDARGHGRSARLYPGENVDMPNDLAGLIRLLELRKPIVGGHSMGGSTAAVTAMLYPDLVSGLVLEDPGWHDPAPVEEKAEETPRPNAWGEWLMGVRNLSLEEVMAKCRADNPQWPEVEVQPWAESKQQLDTTIFQINRRPPHAWREVVAALQCPTLLITAEVEKGAIITPGMAGEVRALNPRVQVAQIARAGHSIRRDNYGDYMKALHDFLKSVR